MYLLPPKKGLFVGGCAGICLNPMCHVTGSQTPCFARLSSIEQNYFASNCLPACETLSALVIADRRAASKLVMKVVLPTEQAGSGCLHTRLPTLNVRRAYLPHTHRQPADDQGCRLRRPADWVSRPCRCQSVAVLEQASSGASSKVPAFPFVKLAGQEDMKLALLLNVVDQAIGGVLIMGDRGTGKSIAVSSISGLSFTPAVVRDALMGSGAFIQPYM